MKTSVLQLKNLIQGFHLSCQTEGKSPKTIEWYATFLRIFLAFLELSNYPTDATQINKEHIRAFILYLQKEARTPRSKKPLSPATVQGYVRTLRVFFSWVVREEYLSDSPTAKIPVPKAPSKVIDTFSNEQIGKLAQACYRSNGNGQRNLTILLLLLDSGIRVTELVNIDCGDANLAEGCGRDTWPIILDFLISPQFQDGFPQAVNTLYLSAESVRKKVAEKGCGPPAVRKFRSADCGKYWPTHA